MEYPLKGVRVLEWAIFHAGPGASAILSDLGAEVVKIESRGGDPIRHRNRFGRTSFDLPGDRSLFFEISNRNKRSITIDLSRKEGKEIIHRLVPNFDVFLTNLRPNTVGKMGMGYAELSKINPRLVYASVSSYGPNGPDVGRGGFDFQGQARSAIMYSMGEPEMPPLLLHFGLIDQVTAIIASQAILVGLLDREKTGKGQEVQTSILGSALCLSYCNFMNALWLHQDVPRHSRLDTDPTRNYYCCKDNKWFAITIQPDDSDWPRFCQAIGRPELVSDERFNSEEKRSMTNAKELINLLDEVFINKNRDEWLEVFLQRDLFACPVNRMTDLENDPQIQANYLDEIEHPSMGKVKVPGFPIHFSRSQAGTTGPAPALGEHTKDVLKEVGYSDKEIAKLEKEEVI